MNEREKARREWDALRVKVRERQPPSVLKRVAFVARSETSKAAAEGIATELGPLQKRVLDCICRGGYHNRGIHHGMTDEEMQEHLFLNPSTQRPRRIELVQAGLVKDSGRTRRTRSGRQAVVWVAA